MVVVHGVSGLTVQRISNATSERLSNKIRKITEYGRMKSFSPAPSSQTLRSLKFRQIVKYEWYCVKLMIPYRQYYIADSNLCQDADNNYIFVFLSSLS
jgi:hypothetical protein